MLGLKQEDASSKFGVAKSTYQKYEAGSSIPGGEAIAGFIGAGINANWLLTGEGPMLLKDLQPPALAAPPKFKINTEALAAIMNALESGLITPDGVGKGAGVTVLTPQPWRRSRLYAWAMNQVIERRRWWLAPSLHAAQLLRVARDPRPDRRPQRSESTRPRR